MPARSDWSHDACSIARGVQAVGDPWTLLVVRELLNGTHRFDALRDRLGIADNMLAARLRTMLDSGLVERTPYLDGRRTRYEYRATPAAHDVLPILHAFSVWATKYTDSTAGHPITIVCRGCGATSTTGEHCSACRLPLTTATTAWIRPSTNETAVPLVALERQEPPSILPAVPGSASAERLRLLASWAATEHIDERARASLSS